MLSVETTDWAVELTAAKDQTKRALKRLREDVERFAPALYQDWWRSCGYETGAVDPENHAFELVALMLPDLIFANPRVRITSPRPYAEAQMKARGLSAATNRWIRDTDMRHLNEELAMDYFFRWYVALVTRTKYPYDVKESEDPPMWPAVERIAPEDFIWDGAARTVKHARFMGHRVVRDREDVLQQANDNPDEEWDEASVRVLAVANRPTDESAHKESPGLARDQVEYYELWVPEIELEDHPDYDKRVCNGSWLTVALGASSNGQERDYFLRAPYPARNPRSGPYVWKGAYIVPGEAATLSPIQSTATQQVALNRAARALDRDIADYKVGVLGPDAAREGLETIQQMRHHGIATVNLPPDQIRSSIVPFQIGGATQQGLEAMMLYRDRLERASGLSAARRGLVTGAGTATENAIANDSATARMAKIAQTFKDGIVDILRIVAFHLDAEDGLVLEFGADARIPLPSPTAEARYVGGLGEGESAIDAEPFDFNLEAYSMGRVPDQVQQQRAANLLGWMQTVATLGPQTPYIDWHQLAAAMADIYSAPELEYMIDYGQMREIGLAMMQAGAMEPPQGQASPQPRLGRDRTSQPSITVSAGGGRGGGGPERGLPDNAGQAKIG